MRDTAGEALTEEAIIAAYGLDAPVRPKNKTISLGTALAMEAAFCEGDPTKRQNTAKRVRQIVGMLSAAGTPILVEHQHLLEPVPEAPQEIMGEAT